MDHLLFTIFMISLLTNLWTHWIRHIVDILLVAYLFYRLFLLIKGTRSVQVVLGVLFLFAGTFIVQDVLHLNAMAWLLQKFWVAGILVVAIVFQPEIRAALAQLGGEPMARWVLPNRFDFVNEIIAALRDCSEKRIGALIVLEQDVGLKNYAATGTKINADISTELILSLLHPRSPLHDGAVIISGNQLTAAGCVLPLTDDPHFAKLLGTRHRAAVGLSESSDALVLVVSEETGQISLARSGRLKRDVDLDEFKAHLHNLFRDRERRSLLRRTEEEG
jgi:diadenylate cyclase